MNIVFWLLIALGLTLAWFCLSFAFKGIGGIGLRLWNDAKREIHDEPHRKNNPDKKENDEHER